MRGDSVSRLEVVTGLICLFHTSVAFADTISIGAAALLPRNNVISYDTNGVRMALTATGSLQFMAPLSLEQGDIIRSVTLVAHDSSGGGSSGGYVRATLMSYGPFNQYLTITPNTAGDGLDTTAGLAPGDTTIAVTDINHQIDNTQHSYGFDITVNTGTGTINDVLFYRLEVEYDRTKLKVINAVDPNHILLGVGL